MIDIKIPIVRLFLASLCFVLSLPLPSPPPPPLPFYFSFAQIRYERETTDDRSTEYRPTEESLRSGCPQISEATVFLGNAQGSRLSNRKGGTGEGERGIRTREGRNSLGHLLVFCFNYSDQMPRPERPLAFSSATRRRPWGAVSTHSRPENNRGELESFIYLRFCRFNQPRMYIDPKYSAFISIGIRYTYFVVFSVFRRLTTRAGN